MIIIIMKMRIEYVLVTYIFIENNNNIIIRLCTYISASCSTFNGTGITSILACHNDFVDKTVSQNNTPKLSCFLNISRSDVLKRCTSSHTSSSQDTNDSACFKGTM